MATTNVHRGDLLLAEFAAQLRCSVSTVRRRIEAGEVRAYKIGRGVRIPAGEVDRLRGDAPPPA